MGNLFYHNDTKIVVNDPDMRSLQSHMWNVLDLFPISVYSFLWSLSIICFSYWPVLLLCHPGELRHFSIFSHAFTSLFVCLLKCIARLCSHIV